MAFLKISFFVVTAFCAIQLVTPASAQNSPNVLISINDFINKEVTDLVNLVVQLAGQFSKSVQDGILKAQVFVQKLNIQNNQVLNSTQAALQVALRDYNDKLKAKADAAENMGKNTTSCINGEADNARRNAQQAGTDFGYCIQNDMRMANGLLYDLSTLSDQVSTFIQDFPDKIIACIKLTPPDVFNCTYNNILAYNSQMGIFAPTLASKLQQVVVQSATLPLDLARCGPSVFYDRTNWFSNRLTIVQYCLDNLPITNPPA